MSNKTISIWPDFVSLSVGFAIVVAIFYFTGLELRFQQDGDWGMYMTFEKDLLEGTWFDDDSTHTHEREIMDYEIIDIEKRRILIGDRFRP